MIGSTVEMNNSLYLKVPIMIEAINQNKYEMLQYNNIKGIINFNRQYFNDTFYLTYNLDTYVSLYVLKNQNGLQDTQLIEILSQINAIILSLEEYFLLEAKDLAITLENIYYDFNKKQVYLVYLPWEQKVSFTSKYKLFLLNLLDSMPLDRKHSLLMNALNGFIHKDEFSIQGLNQLIKNQVLSNSGRDDSRKTVSEEHFFEKGNSLADPPDSKIIEKTVISKNQLIGELFRGVALEAIGLLTMNLIINFFEISDQLNQLITIVMIQLLTFIVIYFIVLKEHYGYEKIIKFFKSKREYERNVSGKENIFASANNPIKGVSEEKISYSTSTVIQGMVEEVYSSKAYLLKEDSISEERIFITEKSFVLGRQVEATDYHIDDSKISKRHLEVLDIDDELFIRDLNSTNGTYLNDEKLAPNRLTKIFDGDLIVIATIAYKFKIE